MATNDDRLREQRFSELDDEMRAAYVPFQSQGYGCGMYACGV